LTLNGRVNGYYQDEVLPSVDFNLKVEDAMFSYPDLPKRAEDIQVSLQTFFDGKQPDNTRVDLEQFHIELAGSPFDATLSLRTPISNPTVDGNMKGQVMLENLADVIPMEETQLRGVIDSDLQFAGSMDMVEKERYNEFQAEGRVTLQDFYFSSPDLPKAVTMNAEMVFNPQYLDIKNFSARVGESDLNFKGQLSNYLSYVLEQGDLKGDFSLSSDYLNVNQFLTESEEEEVADTTAPAELKIFEVPSRLDFKMDAQMKKILYGDMHITDARGTILVKEQTVYLDDFGMGLFDGRMTASGEYSTRDTIRPYASFDMSVKDLQMKNALQTFRVMDSLAPILKQAEGDISLDLQYMSELQENMMPDMKTIDGFGELRSQQIRLKGSRSLGNILNALKISESASERFENVRINFLIRQGELIVKPFDVSMAGIDTNISGSQSYDKTMDYSIDMKIPRAKFGTAANQLFQNLVDKAASKGVDIDPGKNVNMKARVTGTFSEPKVALNMGESEESGGVKQQVEEKVQDIVKEQKEKAEDKVREEASAKAQQIIKGAEERADRIMAEARKTAEKLRQEADKRASQVEKEAEGKNILVRKAAEKSAEKIRQEADRKANQLIKEARNQADSIIQKAKERAQQIENK
ncbi:MAG TPA: AsmA-like C-terminal region-containing protein, partial [Bacteroidales bacterium]|nr:AsmA-like C-terminal region-containing protein [Bacteroidales bacterium]